MSVSVTVDRRCASMTDKGTVYGPPPTWNVVPGGEMMTCAPPIPGDAVGTAAGAGGCAGSAGAGGGVAGGVASGVTGGCATGGVGATGEGAGTVPGTGEEPGGAVTDVPPGRWIVGVPVGVVPAGATPGAAV